MAFFTISPLNSVCHGLLLFLLSAGLTLIMRMKGVLNFSHARLLHARRLSDPPGFGLDRLLARGVGLAAGALDVSERCT